LHVLYGLQHVGELIGEQFAEKLEVLQTEVVDVGGVG
jgi:hypothetical protein